MRAGLILALLLLQPTGVEAAFPAEVVEQGRYLAIAGDCTACHTAPGGVAFAGGRALGSPIGSIIATNITPSRTHGIGNYSERQFSAALRRGIRADGAPLYPAMPYTSYRLLSDADIHALYAYFQTAVAPVDQATAPTKLGFPFNLRSAVRIWNAVSLEDAQFVADPAKSPRWNRGAYLVEGLGHCSVCHSPRNLIMQEKTGKALAGASLGAWYAPNITSDSGNGIGGWSAAELVDYLGTGIAPGRARAAGEMADVVEHSLSRLTAADLLAIAVYLKTVPAVSDAPTNGTVTGKVSFMPIEAGLRGSEAETGSGAALYSGLCASCHGRAGEGSRDAAYPDLFRAGPAGSAGRGNLVAVILNGVDRTVAGKHTFMPGFGADSYVQPLSDDKVAAVANFVRARSGDGDIVTPVDVATVRAGGPPSHLPDLLAGAVALLVVTTLWLVAWRRQRRRL